jgi:hypothetical protein
MTFSTRSVHTLGAWALATTVSACALGPATPAVAQDAVRVNAYGAAVKGFRDRADAYLALHRKAADTVPPLKESDDPAKLTAREQALGEAIRRARPEAKEGELFGADLAPRIRRIVRQDWAKRSAADRAGLLEEIPPGAVADVNATYPPVLPLATFPATLLASLPPLPEGLEYRFVGRHLIIRDVVANIIVDVLRDARGGART